MDDCMTAKWGLLVLYAWDMCDADMNPESCTLDPRIDADGWEVAGIITGADNIIISGPEGIRQSRMSAGGRDDRKRYGFIAKNKTNPNELVAVIRGTDGAEEWFDDLVFIAKKPGGIFEGRVETGFFDIYESLEYFPLSNPNESVPLTQGITNTAGDKGTVMILGHSLGSAIATYLTFALTSPDSLGNDRVTAILFASPKTGDHDFVDAFSKQATHSVVINYEHDLVPKVPPFDITHFDLYCHLPNCTVITDETAKVKINENDKKCCHHLICYLAMLCPEVFEEARNSADWTDDDGNCASCILS